MMACLCGATDCPSCGTDQGYLVAYSPERGYYNPAPGEDYLSPEDIAADKADIANDERRGHE